MRDRSAAHRADNSSRLRIKHAPERHADEVRGIEVFFHGAPELRKFSETMIRSAGQMASHLDNAESGLGAAIWGAVGRKTRRSTGTVQATPTQEQAYFLRVFRAWREVVGCLGVLGDCDEHLRRGPGTRMIASAYFRFVVVGYLQELYILNERLTKFGVLIERCWRYMSAPVIPELFKRLRRLLESSFREILQTRNRHVHEHRFIDADIAKLELGELVLSLLSGGGASKGHEQVTFYKNACRAAKTKWLKQMEGNRKN